MVAQAHEGHGLWQSCGHLDVIPQQQALCHPRPLSCCLLGLAPIWLPTGCRHLDITTTRELNEVKEGLQLAFIEQMVTRDQMYITSTVRPEASVLVYVTLWGVLGGVQGILHTPLCCTCTVFAEQRRVETQPCFGH